MILRSYDGQYVCNFDVLSGCSDELGAVLTGEADKIGGGVGASDRRGVKTELAGRSGGVK